jgi:hypothetical protein
MIICQINPKHLAFKFAKQYDLHVGKYVFMPSGINNNYEILKIVKIDEENSEIYCYNLFDKSTRIHTYDKILEYNPYLKWALNLQ